MEEFAHTASLVELPLAFVTSLVRPRHGASSVAETSLPLAFVDSARLVGVHSMDQVCIVSVRAREGFFAFVGLEVLRLYLGGHLQDFILAAHEEASNKGLHAADEMNVGSR